MQGGVEGGGERRETVLVSGTLTPADEVGADGVGSCIQENKTEGGEKEEDGRGRGVLVPYMVIALESRGCCAGDGWQLGQCSVIERNFFTS